MELKILIIAITPTNFAIELALGDDGNLTYRLQEGYASPAQAAMAVVECLTFAPPDLSIYDTAVVKMGEMVDHVSNIEEAITQLNTRLQDCEDAIQQLAPPPPVQQRVNPLLAGRQPGPTPTAPQSRQAAGVPPSIRRNRVEEPHRPTGGVMRGRASGYAPAPQEEEEG